jgi:hypothetical protein
MDKILKGDISKAFVIAKLLKEGYKVLEPLSENSRYDILVDLNNKFIKIQIKTIYYKNDLDVYEMACYSATRRNKKHIKSKYTPEEVDFIIGYNHDTDEIYTFPINDIAGRHQILFRYNRRNNQYKPLTVKEYLGFKKLKTF